MITHRIECEYGIVELSGTPRDRTRNKEFFILSVQSFGEEENIYFSLAQAKAFRDKLDKLIAYVENPSPADEASSAVA